MNCEDVRQRIKDEIGQGEYPDHDDAVFRHIKQCDLCRHLYTDALLTCALREMPVPEPSGDFASRAIGNAVKTNRMKRIRSFVGIAAAAMLIIASGLMFTRGLQDFQGSPGPSPDSGIMALNGMEKTVRIMIEAFESRKNATLAIDLAENITLKNYPGYRQLTWQTDLTQGRNLLELPLVLENDMDGYVDIRYQYNGNEQQVRIPVRAEIEHEPQKTIRS